MSREINVEDPDNDFSPSLGQIDQCLFPGGIGIRLDTHIYSGYVVSSYYYDSLIAYGQTWSDHKQLYVYAVHSPTIPLHTRILRNSRFLKADVSTNFLENRI